ncbi:TPA: hypothetical protein OMS07_002501 [Klebsiella aerogenes]|nr:hypothetical protein [Klebsiella aerogenes]
MMNLFSHDCFSYTSCRVFPAYLLVAVTCSPLINTTTRFMQNFDFLITPTTASSSFPINLYGPSHIAGKSLPPSAWVLFSALANFTYLPAASVPISFTKDGRSIGLQIMGRLLDDRGVLAL